MTSARGFTLVELLIAGGIIGLAAAAAIPAMNNAVQRNKVITSTELVAAQIREARLAAISRNKAFRVSFNCPAPGALRMLAVTGNAAVDNDVNRCRMNQPNDGPLLYMPQGLSFGNAQPVLEVSARGQISAIAGTMPQTVSVTYGAYSRTLVVSATGRVAIPPQ
jgi:prepilin-type N-terminal cleavage/methylation domain-containing protein